LKRLLTGALGALVSATALPALACPCSDDAAGGLGLTRADERFAAAVVATSRRALGRFDAHARYRALDADERETSEELLVRLGHRPVSDLEAQLELGGASYRLHAGGYHERAVGIGDALLRGRYTLRQESMPHEDLQLPAVALSALLRAPLGGLTEGRSSGFGSGGAPLGLGAWEAGAGVDAARSVSRDLSLIASAELAYRFEDHVLGVARRLGPRAEINLGARLFSDEWLSGSVALRARFTGDVSLGGRTLSGTAERLWTLVVGVGAFDRRSRLRSAITLSVDPPWDVLGLSVGSTSSVALGCSLGYGF
jgi:hypothetical protein